jgi:hypothetical protein
VARHPRSVAAVALILGVVALLGFLWFRPDKLFVNTEVNESLPGAGPAAEAEGERVSQLGDRRAPVPEILSTGTFRSLEHETTGTARVVRLGDGRPLVRFEDFATSSGPDVIVMLSETPATEDDWYAYDDGEFVALGPLKGNIGTQNYGVPRDVDISDYRSVVVWCRRFTVGFGAAPLEA